MERKHLEGLRRYFFTNLRNKICSCGIFVLVLSLDLPLMNKRQTPQKGNSQNQPLASKKEPWIVWEMPDIELMISERLQTLDLDRLRSDISQ